MFPDRHLSARLPSSGPLCRFIRPVLYPIEAPRPCAPRVSDHHFPPAHAVELFLHVSVACSSATRKARSAAARSVASGVIDGTRPSGGSTMSDVRRPVRFIDMKSELYAPATSSSVPRSTRRSRPRSATRSLSSSARSSSVKNSRVRVTRRSLERRVELVGPDALQVGLTPRRPWSAACLGRPQIDRYGDGGDDDRHTDDCEKAGAHRRPPAGRIARVMARSARDRILPGARWRTGNSMQGGSFRTRLEEVESRVQKDPAYFGVTGSYLKRQPESQLHHPRLIRQVPIERRLALVSVLLSLVAYDP